MQESGGIIGSLEWKKEKISYSKLEWVESMHEKNIHSPFLWFWSWDREKENWDSQKKGGKTHNTPKRDEGVGGKWKNKNTEKRGERKRETWERNERRRAEDGEDERRRGKIEKREGGKREKNYKE